MIRHFFNRALFLVLFIIPAFFLISLEQKVAAGLSSKDQMREFIDLTAWYNSPPIKKKQLEGKVTALVFFDFFSASNIHVTNFLRALQEVYSLSLINWIGVINPTQPFEDVTYQLGPLKRNRVRIPVAYDGNNRLSTMYGLSVFSKPCILLFDDRQRLRFTFQDPIDPIEFEKTLRSLILEKFSADDMPYNPVFEKSIPTRVPTHSYSFNLKYLSGFGNLEPPAYGVAKDYQLSEYLRAHHYYLIGKWTHTEFSAKNSSTPSSALFLIQSNDFYAILGAAQSETKKVKVKLDGQWIPNENKGEDIEIENESSILNVDTPRMFHLVRDLDAKRTHKLELIVDEGEIMIYNAEEVLEVKSAA